MVIKNRETMKGLTKEEIILKAVNTWNENNFQNISLSPVAKALKISKPALYKHFHDKEELITEIYRYFDLLQIKFWRDFFDKQKGFSGNILRLLIRSIAVFLHKKPEFLMFRKYMFVSKRQVSGLCKTYIENVLTKEELNDIYSKFDDINCPIKGRDYFFAYLFTIVEIWMSLQDDVVENSEMEIEKYPKETLFDVCADQVSEIIEYGFFKDDVNTKDIDFSSIEEEIKNREITDDLPEEAVLNAIADVIIEEGYWNISVNKIAAKMHITKSSLYNYFENKKTMISDSLFRRLHNFKKYFNEETFQRTNGFEVWYLLIYFFYHTFRSNIRHTVIMNWIATKDYSKITIKGKTLDVLKEIYKIKIPKTRKLFCGTVYFPFIIIQILIVRYVFFALLKGINSDLEQIRNLYKLSVYGIKKGDL